MLVLKRLFTMTAVSKPAVFWELRILDSFDIVRHVAFKICRCAQTFERKMEKPTRTLASTALIDLLRSQKNSCKIVFVEQRKVKLTSTMLRARLPVLNSQTQLQRRLFHAALYRSNNQSQTQTETSGWSKASLRRLRKNQLEDLAIQHKLDANGTKSQLIDRLLLHQNGDGWRQGAAAVAATDKGTADARVQDAVTAEAATRGKREPDTFVTPLDTLSEDVQEHVHNKTGITSRYHHNGDLEAANWVEAFELKVNQPRRTREHPKESFFPAQQQRDLNKSIPRPSSHSQPEIMDNNIPEDVDQHWVKAFEQKVNSRDARHRLLGNADTFSPSSLETSGLEFVSSSSDDSSTRGVSSDAQGSPNTELQKSMGMETDSNKNESTSNSKSSHWLINSLIGSSLLIWIAGGEQGFKKLAELL